jgi:hypothetical protein
MLIVRFCLVALLLATLVLGAAYLFTRNRAYLLTIKKMYRYAAYFFGLALVVYAISRVIRL